MSDMKGQLQPDDVKRYIEGGNATFTIRNPQSGNRFTYKAGRPEAGSSMWAGNDRPIWLNVLNGPDNENSYLFIGTIWPKEPTVIRRSSKSKVSEDAASFKALEWLFRHLTSPAHLAKIEIWHEGKCGRCGRKLTVPESIERGFGPECTKHIGG